MRSGRKGSCLMNGAGGPAPTAAKEYSPCRSFYGRIWEAAGPRRDLPTGVHL